MNKLFIVAIFTCNSGVTTIETTICNDKTEAEVKIAEEFEYAQSQTDTEDVFYGYDAIIPYWYEVGKTTDKFWSRGEIQVKTA